MNRIILTLAALTLAAPCYGQETRSILKGSTDQSVYIRIVDAADGTPETGVTSATAGLDLEYVRNRAAAADLTESDLAAVDSAHSDGGIKHVGNGVYRVDLPDAACATGVDGVLVTGTATDMVVIPARIQLTGFDLQDAVPAVDVTHVLGEAVDASPTPLDVNVVSTDAGAITATSFAAGAMDAAATAADFIAEVKTQVVDALTTDTYAEPTGVPAATDDLATKISYLYNFLLRNRIDVTASKKTFYDDGGAAEFEKDLTDDGTTYSETEVNAP